MDTWQKKLQRFKDTLQAGMYVTVQRGPDKGLHGKVTRCSFSVLVAITDDGQVFAQTYGVCCPSD